MTLLPRIVPWKETRNSPSRPILPKVCPKLGEQRRTQAKTSAGSGDLQPTLGEETAPSLVQDQCAALLCNWQCYRVFKLSFGERCDQVPGVPPVDLATLPTTKCLSSPNALSRQPLSTSAAACSSVPCIAPAVPSPSVERALQCPRRLLPTSAQRTDGFLAHRLVHLMRLEKQDKHGDCLRHDPIPVLLACWCF